MEDASKFKGDVLVAMVLDKSGSMGAIKGATVEGFNHQLQTLRDTSPQGGDTKTMLTVFDGEVEVGDLTRLSEMKDLTDKTYCPGGVTAMYDAVGKTIEKIRSEVTDHEDQSYLVVVVSDGMENASREFDGGEIASMVKELQDTGRWTFAYLGANQDLTQVRKSTGMLVNNMASFDATDEGMRRAMYATASATGNYMSARAKNVMRSASFYSGDANRNVSPDPRTSEAAKILGRMGGLKGGVARARKLPPQRRAEIARQAAKSRWTPTRL